MSSASLFDAFKNYMAKNYGKSHGKMLIHTGVIGWILSAAAQVMAIVTNDKISYKQKMYLIPQELADAAVNIVSFYCSSIPSVREYGLSAFERPRFLSGFCPILNSQTPPFRISS